MKPTHYLKQRIYWFICSILIIGVISPVFAKPQSLEKIVKKLVKSVQKSQNGNRPLRLAVMDFAATNPNATDEFRAYFAETLTTALSKSGKKFRLFERKRLDVILSEYSLSLSGMIDAEQAQKLGELVPIDAILSGTYTKFTDYIAINSRLIDAVTGEILLSFSDKIRLDKNLAGLFSTAPNRPDAIDQKSAAEICAEKEAEIRTLLNDLSGESQINAIVQKATKIPFEIDCGRIHFVVVSRFNRYQIQNAKYHQFLTNTLKTIQFPGNDDRARTIFRYFVADGNLDDDEWAAGLNILKKMSHLAISSHISTLLNPKKLPADLSITFKRLDEYCQLVQQRKIGLPVPISFTYGFIEALEGFNHIYSKDNRVLIYLYQKYGDQLAKDKKTAKRIHGFLESLYIREPNLSEKRKILDWVCDDFNSLTLNEDFATDLYQFAQKFEITDYKRRNPEKLKEAPIEHFPILLEKCQTLFCEALKLAKYNSQKVDRIDFCIENGIACDGFIPTVAECIVSLTDPDDNQKLRTMEILEKMGKVAAPAEDAVLEALDVDDHYNSAVTSRIQQSAVTVLGNIGTKSPKSLNVLIASLTSLHSYVPTKALDALVKIGKPAVPYLINALDGKQGAGQYKAAVGLGRIGKPAKSALPKLKEIVENSNNSAVIQAAKKAIKKIEKALK